MTEKEEKINVAVAKALGWEDIHGGPPDGVFWRGINPKTKRCEEVPDFLNDLNAMQAFIRIARVLRDGTETCPDCGSVCWRELEDGTRRCEKCGCWFDFTSSEP